MNQEMIQDIKENLVRQLVNKYGITDIREIGGYQNFIFEIDKDHSTYVLRVTDKKHRHENEIEAEVTFLNELSINQAPIAKGVKIPYCYVVETFYTDKFEYLVVLFEKAVGNTWVEHRSSQETYYQAGAALGKIHNISKQMKSKLSRTKWYENQYIMDAYQVIPDKEIITKMEKLIVDLHELPRGKESYGLVHGDYNFGNLIYQENHLTVIDFDESEYHWFIYDIAVYLFYYLLGGDPANIDIEPNITLYQSFMKGYLTQNKIDVFWIEKLPLFFRLREFILLSSIYRNFNTLGPWQKAYVSTTEYRIKHDLPFVDIDYKRLFLEL